MKKKFVSLKVKFFFLALIAAVVPSVFVGTAMYQKTIQVAEQKQEAAVQSSLQNISNTIMVNVKYARSTSLNFISNDNVRKALFLKNPGSDVALKWRNQITNDFYFYTSLSSYIDGIYLMGCNGVDISIGTVDKSLLTDNIQEMEEARGGVVWKWLRNGEHANFVLLREIRDIDKPYTSLGYLQIVLRNNEIKEQFESFLDAFSGYIGLWDINGGAEQAFGIGECPKDRKFLEDLLKEDSSFHWTNNDGILTYCYKIKDSHWALYSSMEASELFAENAMIRDMFVEIILAALCICLVVVFIFARMITKPLKELTEQTKEISKGNYDIHLNIVSNDEIGILSDNFNEMAKRLDELVNEVLRGKVLQQEAQFNALQTQINPHFLYNNLDTAYWMSRMEKAEKTGKILLALSSLYRSAANTNAKIISVEDEIKYTKEYIMLQELRLGNQITFEFHVEELTRQQSTLRFILQPLIENSIEHGILPTGEPGQINIWIYQDEQFLYFTIEDSGIGASAEEIMKILEADETEGRRGMAIRNIHQRLRIQYGPEYGLIFRQADSGGILTVVRQPIVAYMKKTDS